ncbi:hypothetical protein KA005_71015, partial [bacterium]|nr:hypothetical protein [bacterium]
MDHLFEIQILVLMVLFGLLSYLVRKRRSKTLSVLVERKFAEYKRKLRRRLSLSERLSSREFAFMAFMIPIVSSGVLGILGWVLWRAENDPQDMERFLGTLHTCGAIVASFTAIVITVTTFAITVNSRYIGRTSSLIKFFLENLAFKPLATFAVGSIVAIIFNSLLANYFQKWSIVCVLWPLVIVGGIVICADLVFLLRATKLIGLSSMSGFLIGAYKNIHRDSLLAHVKRTLAQTTNAQVLEKLGFLWNPYGQYGKTERAEYSIKSGGLFVNDVYFGHLEKLGKKWNLRPIEREEKQQWSMNLINPPNIIIWPGQKLPEKEDQYAAMFVKDAKCERKAQKVFTEAIVCGKKDRWRIPPVEWSEIAHLLKTLIEQKDIAGVKSVLEAFRSIAADYLESRLQIEWPHTVQTLDEEIMSPYRAPTLRNLDFFNFIRFVIRNEDEECLDEVGGFLYGMANTAFEFESELYFDEVLVRLNWLYELSRGSERLAKRATAIFVRHYKNVGKIFDYHIYEDEDNPDSYDQIMPFVQKYLKNILNGM